MATITITSELDVLSKYQCIMEASLNSESVYIRTKETLAALMADGALSTKEQGEVISNVLTNLTSALVSAGLSTALQWASQEKDIALRKLELAKQLDLLDAQKALQDAQADKIYSDDIATQANTIRVLGVPTIIDGKVVSLNDSGQIWQNMQLVAQQQSNLVKEAVLIDSRVKESQAGVHKLVADTVVNYGPWSYVLSENGISSAPTRAGMLPASVVPLSDTQREVAQEQAKGYAYNAWANAVTASAGMIGTAIASDGAITDINSLVNIAKAGMTKLVNVKGSIFTSDENPAPSTPVV